jgi:hypothetical protein
MFWQYLATALIFTNWLQLNIFENIMNIFENIMNIFENIMNIFVDLMHIFAENVYVKWLLQIIADQETRYICI